MRLLVSLHVFLTALTLSNCANAEATYKLCQVQVSGLPIAAEKPLARRDMVGKFVEQLSTYGQPIGFVLDDDRSDGSIIVAGSCEKLLKNGHNVSSIEMVAAEELMSPKCEVLSDIAFGKAASAKDLQAMLVEIQSEASGYGYPLSKVEISSGWGSMNVKAISLRMELYAACASKVELVDRLLNNALINVNSVNASIVK